MAEAAKSKLGLIIIIVVALLIIGVVIFIFKDKLFGVKCDPNRNGFDAKGNPNPKCQFSDPAANNDPAPSGSGGWVSDANFPIRKGSWGAKVAGLQKAMGFPTGTCSNCADGRFGSITEAALVKKTGKNQVDNQAEYDKIVNPVATPVGGNNFDKVKAALGSAGTLTSGGVVTTIKGENKPYRVTFSTNNRVSFKDETTNTIWNGSYKDGGKEIAIDAAYGGYSTGTWLSNSSVTESMKNIINKIEGN